MDRGEKLFEQYARIAKEQGAKELSGKDVWRLYDTFGFPVDLTRLMAEERRLGVNDAEYEAAQAASKEASKGAKRAGALDLVKLDVHDIAALEKNTGVSKTDDTAKFSKFELIPFYSGFDIIRFGEYYGTNRSHFLQQILYLVDLQYP